MTLTFIPPVCTTSPPPQRTALLKALSAPTRTSSNSAEIASLVSSLESAQPRPPPATSPLLPGLWRVLHTTLPKTASPLQRAILSRPLLAPSVEQLILPGPTGLVTRIDIRPMLGAVLNVRAEVTDVQGSRILLRFVEAWFAVCARPGWLGGGRLERAVRVPYPVPFRLLGEKVAGWVDVCYLDERVRVARGNKGSTFVLERRGKDAEGGGLDGWVD